MYMFIYYYFLKIKEMFRHRRMEITYTLYVRGKAKKVKAIVIFHGQI